MNNYTAFVSYSWDSKEHQEWVIKLTNKLRRKGIEATLDIFETQKRTTNLHSMMVKNINLNDFVILIISEKYTEKADNIEGGVGYETELILPLMQTNKDKIIPIIRSENQEKYKIPFYLNGIHYYDFSDDTKFDKIFEELLHRLIGVERYLIAPLGDIPELQPKDLEKLNKVESNEYTEMIPNFKQNTDLEKNKFMKDSFNEMKCFFRRILELTKNSNQNFEYEYDEITSKKIIFKMYIDGKLKYSVKMWLDSRFGDIENIKFSYGNRISSGDNSMNEIISCKVDENNNLKLKMTMNMFINQKYFTAIEIAGKIWENSLNVIK